jgi:hypothetical protein
LGGHPDRYTALLACNTPRGISRVWPEPGKKPSQNVDRAVFVAVDHQATGFTAIRSLVEWHGLLLPTATTGLTRIAFIYPDQIFPSQRTLVGEHLDKGVHSPIVVDRPMHRFLVCLMRFHDHLPLGKITDDNSSFNQFVCDEMRGLMQTVTLFVALLF